MKTLVVEDDLTSRLVLQEMLKEYGSVDIAVNGRESVELVKVALANRKPYDLICMDIRMPEMDGQEALKEIRNLEAGTDAESVNPARVVMITMLDDGQNIVKAFREQCDGYLVKPIDKTKLSECLKTCGLVE